MRVTFASDPVYARAEVPANPIDRIVAMLDDQAPERRMAAAIVLGELGVASPKALAGFVRLLEQNGAPLQRHALDALTRVGAGKALPSIWPLLASRDESVRAAAADAVASIGESVVPEVRTRLSAAQGDERHVLESILARLGGKQAFDALLESLAGGDEQAHRATALELRRHVKSASAGERRGYRPRIEKLLSKLSEASARAAAVKVLGYLEDPKCAPLLLELVKATRESPLVRQEALIALRFAMTEGMSEEALRAVVSAASSTDRGLAQAALMTLAALDVPAAMSAPLADLALHGELDRARLAIEKLGAISGGKATQTLVAIVARGDRKRSELAAGALASREDATAMLVDELARNDDADRARMLRAALAPHVERLTPAMRRKLIDAGSERLGAGGEGWETLFAIAAERDPKAVSEALRAQAAKLRKSKKTNVETRALHALVRMEQANDDDRYRLASLLLHESRLDPRERESDPAVHALDRLQQRGFDVIKALKGDRSIELEHLYYVGFCFLETGEPLGADLLQEVVRQGGKKKIAQAAKNKIKLAAQKN